MTIPAIANTGEGQSHARAGLRPPPALFIRRLPYPGACVLFALGLALFLTLPYLVGLAGVAPGFTFRGTLWAIDDESQYISAVREGAQGLWLWHNPFMAQAPAPILMYPTYMLAGRIGDLAHLSVRMAYVLYHPLSFLILFGALWQLARVYGIGARERAWLIAFALGTSGLYWFNLLLALAGHALVPISMLGSPQLSGFTMAMLDGHRALGMAGGIAAIAGLQGTLYEQRFSTRCLWVLYGSAGIALVGLNMVMMLPLFATVLGGVALMAIGSAPHERRRQALIAAARAASPLALLTLAFVAYYGHVFSSGPWSNPAFKRVAPPPTMEFVLVLGMLLPLAWWGWYAASPAMRPLANALALWCCFAVVGRELPFWQSVRFTDGINLAIGGLVGIGILSRVRSAAWRSRLLLILSLGALMQYLLLLSDLAGGRAASLYDTPPVTQAIHWLASHCRSQDVVLTSYRLGNVLPEATSCRVVVGHPQQTLDIDERYPQVQTFFSATANTVQRLQALRATTATLVIYDPDTVDTDPFDPSRLPGLRRAFAADGLLIQRVVPTHAQSPH